MRPVTPYLAIWMVIAAATDSRADQSGVAYGVAVGELSVGGVIAIHTFTPSSPGKGYGLALNSVPVVLGVGTGLLAEHLELDARPAFGFHGVVVGGLSMMMIGASIDGRGKHDGLRLGGFTWTLGALGAAAGGYLMATKVESGSEAVAVGVAPFAGAFGGALVAAIVHFVDDRGPEDTGRLVQFAGVGMLVGTAGSLIYSLEDRGSDPSASRTRGLRLVSFGGSF